MRSVQAFFFLVSALQSSRADTSLSVPSVTSENGAIRALVSKASVDRYQGDSQGNMEALDWASAVGQHEKVSAEVQKLQQQTTARFSIDQLLQFLDDVDRRETPLSETEFIPRCVAHAEKVLKMISATYGADKLQEIVSSQCLQNDDFPLAHVDAFNKKQACQNVVDDLTKIQDQELKTRSRKQYFNFCNGYVRNKDSDGLPAPYGLISHGATRQRTATVSSGAADAGSGASPGIPFTMLTLLAALIIVGAAFFTLRQGS
jgi:hypothetical protein